MATSARVDGIDLVVTRTWSSRPRVSSGGRELPKDPAGHYELRGPRGRVRRVDADFDWHQFGPRLRVGDEQVLLGRPLPFGVRAVLLVLVVLGLLGGVLGVALMLASAIGAAGLLRRTDRRPWHVAVAVVLPLVAALAYLAGSTLLASGR